MITKSTLATLLVLGLPSTNVQMLTISETVTTSLFALAMLCLCLAIKLEK